METKCDFCGTLSGETQRIEVDWDHAYVRVCPACVAHYTAYAIECSCGSIARAIDVRDEVVRRAAQARAQAITEAKAQFLRDNDFVAFRAALCAARA
jgi:ribosome-binding protein aMBF1 (putative translation factor)